MPALEHRTNTIDAAQLATILEARNRKHARQLARELYTPPPGGNAPRQITWLEREEILREQRDRPRDLPRVHRNATREPPSTIGYSWKAANHMQRVADDAARVLTTGKSTRRRVRFLSPNARDLYKIITKLSRATGQCQVTIRFFADRVGCHRATIFRAIDELVAADMLTVKPQRRETIRDARRWDHQVPSIYVPREPKSLLRPTVSEY